MVRVDEEHSEWGGDRGRDGCPAAIASSRTRIYGLGGSLGFELSLPGNTNGPRAIASGETEASKQAKRKSEKPDERAQKRTPETPL